MKHRRLSRLLFPAIIIVLPIIIFCVSLLINGEKKVVNVENRTASTIESLKFTSFDDGTFQQSFESILLDQFPLSEELKVLKNKVDSNIADHFRKDIVKQNCEVGRYLIRDGVYSFFCTDYLVFEENSYEYAEKRLLDTQKSLIGYDFNNADYYAYLINDSRTFSDLNLRTNDQIYEIFKHNFESLNFTCSEFRLNSIEDYMNYFYKTDHHWNIQGAYCGYKDILDLLNVSDHTTVKGSNYLKQNFCGSSCRKAAYFGIEDRFEILNYNTDDLTIYVNGELSEYGNEDILGVYDAEKNANYYGIVFGFDQREIKIINESDKEGSLLIISNSFSNPINKMLANNFKETYIIDLRYYWDNPDLEFNLEEYVNEHNIDKVLLLGDIDYFYNLEYLLRYKG